MYEVVRYMLFISRRIGSNGYGVADSETGVEEVVSRDILINRCCAGGEDIKGVVAVSYGAGSVLHSVIERIDTYQLPETQSVNQLKARFLGGVEVRTWKDMITEIIWDKSQMKYPVSIDLAKFGTSCADRILINNPVYGDHAVTLCVDGSLSFSKQTFYVPYNVYIGVEGVGVVFDLRKCDNDDIAQVVYNALVDSEPHGQSYYTDIFRSVIDIPERKAKMKSWYDSLLF